MHLRFGLIALAVLCSPLGATASPIVFTNRAAFEAATQPNVRVPFDSIDRNGLWGEGGFCDPRGLPWCSGTADGQLSIFTSDEFFVDPFGGNLTMDGLFSYADFALTGNRSFTAVGFDISASSPGQRLTALGYDFDSVPSFLGFVFTDPLDWFQLVPNHPQCCGGHQITFDNFVFRTVPVPEPPTALLLFGALALVHCVRYRRRSSAPDIE